MTEGRQTGTADSSQAQNDGGAALNRRPVTEASDRTVKIIELEQTHPTLDEVMGLAKDELVVLRKPDGSVFALSQVDDFDVEVELLKNNPEFMAFLKQLSQEKATISLEALRKELAL